MLPLEDGELSISKEVLQELPEGYEETSLGEKRDAIRQFRGPSGLHIREYNDRFVIHQDKIDPRRNPIGHLLLDAPERPLALATSFFLTDRSKSIYHEKNERPSSFHPLLFLFTFLSLNRVFNLLKHLLF